MKRIDEEFLVTKRMDQYQGPIYVHTAWPYICVKVMPYSRKSTREDARRGWLEKSERLGWIYCKAKDYRIYAYPVGSLYGFNEHRSKETEDLTRSVLNAALKLFISKQNEHNLRKYEDWNGDPCDWDGPLYEEWKANYAKEIDNNGEEE